MPVRDILFNIPKCSVSVTLQQHTFFVVCVYMFSHYGWKFMHARDPKPSGGFPVGCWASGKVSGQLIPIATQTPVQLLL